MKDPVIVSGSPCHPTVERRAIESYLAIERSICPVSQKPLEDRTLIPETKLMQAISWWKNSTGWKNQTLVSLNYMSVTQGTEHFNFISKKSFFQSLPECSRHQL